MAASQALQADVVPSDLDEATHAELRLLYDESARTILFAKERQWKTLAFTTLTYVLLIAVAEIAPSHTGFVKTLAFFSFLVSPVAISMLIIFHLGQLTEFEKRRAISQKFSSVFSVIRGLQSKTEANIQRYILLTVMIAVVVSGNVITYLLISWLYV